MVKAFSDGISTGCTGDCSTTPHSCPHIRIPKKIDSISSKSLNTKSLSPFSKTISTINWLPDQFQELGYVYTKLKRFPWWEAAFDLFKKQKVSWKEIMDAAKFSYAGRSSASEMKRTAKKELGDINAQFYINKQRRWARILQAGWPELHGKPGESFRFAQHNEQILPVAPEPGSLSSTFFKTVERIKKTSRKIMDGDIAAALEIYYREGITADLSPDQTTILQTGWPHLLGPPGQGIPIEKYHPDAAQLKNMFPEGTTPDYQTLKILREKGFFEKSQDEKNAIIEETGIYIKGYFQPISPEAIQILIARGFGKTDVARLKALNKKGPETGYTRYTDPDKLPRELLGEKYADWAEFMVRIAGFIDLSDDVTKAPHQVFTPKGKRIIKEISPEMQKKLEEIEQKIAGKEPEPKAPEEKAPEPKVPEEKELVQREREAGLPKNLATAASRLIGGLTSEQKEKIISLEKTGPESGYTRVEEREKFARGEDKWLLIHIIGYIDVDREGNLHPAFRSEALPHLKKSAETAEERFVQATMYYHPEVGYY